MTTIEDDAGLREAFAAAGTEAPAPERCPDPDRIYDAVRGRLPPDQVRDLVDHLAACPGCAEAWRLAMAFEDEAGAQAAVGRAPEAPSGGPGRRGWWAVAAAAVVALAGASLWWSVTQGPVEAPVYRGEGEPEIRSLLPEGELLDRDEPVLRWSPVPQDAPAGTFYDVTVSTEDLRLLAEAAGLEEPEYRLPDGALAEVPPGGRLLWQVEAELADGRTVRSPTFSTTVE